MGVARGIERRLERLVDGFASRLFRGRMHPVELGAMLVREADLALIDRPAGPTAPNLYRITMGGEQVEREVLDPVAAELARFVEDAAADRGWRLEGPARVGIVIADDHRAADASVKTAFKEAPLAPWAVLHPLDPSAPAREVGHIRTLVGRGSDADIQITSDTVSRAHALVWQEAGAAWVADLDSANGTYVNGSRVVDPVGIAAGDLLTFGDVGFTVKEP